MRFVVPAITAVAAVGAAVMVATGVIGGSGGMSGAGGRPSAPAHQLAQGQNVAFVVSRVRAQLATSTDDVIEYRPTSEGASSYDTWGYADPQTGAHYLSSVGMRADGTIYYTETQDGVPNRGGLKFANVYTDPINQTYAVYNYRMSTVQPLPFADVVRQLRSQLQSGQATREGTATVNGRQALKISILAPNGNPDATSTLYVNPQSYTPIQLEQGDIPVIIRWLPATPENIAKAEPVQIPTGYTQLPLAEFDKTADRNSAN